MLIPGEARLAPAPRTNRNRLTTVDEAVPTKYSVCKRRKPFKKLATLRGVNKIYIHKYIQEQTLYYISWRSIYKILSEGGERISEFGDLIKKVRMFSYSVKVQIPLQAAIFQNFIFCVSGDVLSTLDT